MRSSQLRRQGISEALIASAVSGGRLVRVRRRWVASPDADPYVVSAARAGVVLSCVTTAAGALAIRVRLEKDKSRLSGRLSAALAACRGLACCIADALWPAARRG